MPRPTGDTRARRTQGEVTSSSATPLIPSTRDHPDARAVRGRYPLRASQPSRARKPASTATLKACEMRKVSRA
eukprot:scaffold77397_cov61-Phaeocystis_antarctica.AAC.8